MHEEIDARKLRRDNLKRWSVLEDTIFCVTENTRINQIRLSIDSLENEDKDTVYRLLLHTAELRPDAYALLAQIWDFIEENPPLERLNAVQNEPQLLLDVYFVFVIIFNIVSPVLKLLVIEIKY